MRKELLAVAVLLSLFVSSCATHTPQPLTDPITLSARPQPKFEVVRYASLPTDVVMRSQMSTSDLREHLKALFPSLRDQRASLALEGEDLVEASGSYFRRVWFYFGDEATLTMHGTCGQNIYVWLAASGEITDIYLDPLNCPI